jgi:integrase/recombinase XerD
MRNRCSYAGLVSAYFSVYLAGTKNVSTNTIYSYRDTFVIFHGYLEKYCGFKLEKMLFNDLSRELILEFLQYLETERKCSISSRNQRLAALKSFAKYVQIECPDEMILCQRILSIDSKKAAKPTVQYLSNQQTDILMEQPDISTPKGRRDLAMILLLYDSAARVQELCDLRICDIRIDSLPVVHLLGKGRKSRDVPLTKPCAQVLRQYICENHLDIPERRNDQLFTNPQ